MDNYSVTYLIKNDLGGITSLIKNLIDYKGDIALEQKVILMRIADSPFAPPQEQFSDKISTLYFDFNKKNNFYYSFRKLQEKVGSDEGVLISNDTLDLLMLSYYNIQKKIIQIVHDAYNVTLSIKFEDVIDCFICHSVFYFEVLCQLLPHRRKDIYLIRYGIPILPVSARSMERSHLNLIFIGRHDKMKGVFDLFEINEILKANNIPVRWLILGSGPESGNLKEQWKEQQNISFYVAKSTEEVLRLCGQQDLFIFPTKFEGFPVAMVEAMSVGCVPIVSDLPGGIRELGNNENGIICGLDNNVDFAAGVIKLFKNRKLLNEMSCNCKDFIFKNHNAIYQSPKYQQLFKNVAYSNSNPRHHSVKRKLGSRLDQPYIPNHITRILRDLF